MVGQSPAFDTIFCAAIEIASAEDRAAYLAQVCGEDLELRGRVEGLVAAHLRAGSFMKRPADGLGATIDLPGSEGPGDVVGAYKILEPIGDGGFGIVFVAEQVQPVRRRVALKLLKPGMDSKQVIARFEAERQALAMMDHPNIARVFDGGAALSGRPYFVMELVKGVPINQYCDDHKLSPRERLALFLPVCAAVQHAHQKGIIHRDLKPSNVLVSRHDSTPVVKVIDFGVAKALGQELTEKTLFTGIAQMIGTPLYMSPEQAGMSDLDVDTRSDVYSLGVLLYELLTGTTPFDKQRFKTAGYDEMRRIIREEEPPKPSTRISTLGQAATTVSTQRRTDARQLSRMFRGELDWIVMKALEKDRNRRYETANGFAIDVERYLNDEPVLACPPTMGYRLKKFVRRNKAPVLAASLVLLALVAGVIGTTIGLIRAEQQRQIAQDNEQKALTAAAAEKKAKETAEAVGAEIKAVVDFVEDKVFAAARPKDQERGLGYDVKLREAIELAAPFVGKSFPQQPLIEARLRMTIGTSFWYLGDAKAAAEQYEAARALYARHRGLDHPDTLRSMGNLANSYGALGRHAEALKLREETLALSKAALGPHHPDMLKGMQNLTASYVSLGRYAEALKLQEETLALQ